MGTTFQDASVADLRFVTEQFQDNQSAIASLFDVDRSSVNRWLKGKDAPAMENQVKIVALRLILIRLLQIFKPETSKKWLLGINAYLGNNRPIDLIKQKRFSEVLAAVEQADAGSYA